MPTSDVGNTMPALQGVFSPQGVLFAVSVAFLDPTAAVCPSNQPHAYCAGTNSLKKFLSFKFCENKTSPRCKTFAAPMAGCPGDETVVMDQTNKEATGGKSFAHHSCYFPVIYCSTLASPHPSILSTQSQTIA